MDRPSQPSKPRVVVTRKLPGDALERLSDYADMVLNESDVAWSKEELIKLMPETAGLLCLLSDPIDESVMAASDKLKVISNYAVGFNNIDITTATARNIAVCNTPGVLTDDSADLAFFNGCVSGPSVPLSGPETCGQTDLDDDGDTDQSDFGLLQRCFTGPNDPPQADCIEPAS